MSELEGFLFYNYSKKYHFVSPLWLCIPRKLAKINSIPCSFDLTKGQPWTEKLTNEECYRFVINETMHLPIKIKTPQTEISLEL